MPADRVQKTAEKFQNPAEWESEEYFMGKGHTFTRSQ